MDRSTSKRVEHSIQTDRQLIQFCAGILSSAYQLVC